MVLLYGEKPVQHEGILKNKLSLPLCKLHDLFSPKQPLTYKRKSFLGTDDHMEHCHILSFLPVLLKVYELFGLVWFVKNNHSEAFQESSHHMP